MWRIAADGLYIKGATEKQKTIFYTALYHMKIDPRAFTDVDGRYLGADGKIHSAEDFTYRTVFSGWDVFRSQFPLLTIIDPQIIEDEINCPRYSSRVVTGVKIKESPEWLKKIITTIGLRPINNIVDITNFVMHECGQPLHAFDLELLKGKQVIIKSTRNKSKFTTLDSKERTLNKDTSISV